MAGTEAALLTFLLNALWQAPLIAATAWGGAGLLRRAPAAYRHRLWTVALALSLLSPLASSLAPAKAGAAGHGAGPGSAIAEAGGRVGDEERGAMPIAKQLGLHERIALGGLGRAAAVGYLLFLFLKVIRLVTAWRRTAGLVRRAHAAPAPVVVIAAECPAGPGREVSIWVSDEAAAPMTFGLTRPVIVLPSRLAERATAEDLRGVLAHELSHVARRDCALNLACELLGLPVSFHPALGFLRRRISGAREAACDEAAAALVGRSVYAATLLEVAVSASRPSRLAGALGVLDGDALEDRMKRILDVGDGMGRRAATLTLGAAMLALVLTSRWVSASALAVTTEVGPSQMVGRWTGEVAEGPMTGRPAAELTITLTRNGPEIELTLYRYQLRPDGSRQADPQRLPVVRHAVEKGVLQFRTHSDDFRLHPDDPPAATDTDWEFVVVGKDAGQLRVLRNSKLEADRAQGKDVPPRPPTLPMTRLSKL